MKSWNGVWVALATPFKDGKVDLPTLRTFTQSLISAGVHGLCPAGTTGEGSSLEDDEFEAVVQTVLQEAAGKIPVVPGTGSNNTKKTIERTLHAEKLGANGALVVTPYYVKPTPDGLVRHYGMVSEKSKLPLMLYNVPGRTAVNMMPETTEKIVNVANVKAVKECAELPQVDELLQRIGDRVQIFSGEDPVLVPALSIGVKGIVSVAANIIPEIWVEVYEKWMTGEYQDARVLFMKYTRLVDALFCESNPIPVKFALEKLKMMSAETRSPLAPISLRGAQIVLSQLKIVGTDV